MPNKSNKKNGDDARKGMFMPFINSSVKDESVKNADSTLMEWVYLFLSRFVWRQRSGVLFRRSPAHFLCP